MILAVVVRSEASLESYGTNLDLLLRPDSAIFVVRTSRGFLITYSLATDSESRVYKPYFTSIYKNIVLRIQSSITTSHAVGSQGADDKALKGDASCGPWFW